MNPIKSNFALIFLAFLRLVSANNWPEDETISTSGSLKTAFEFVENMDVGLAKAMEESKPIFFLVHQTHCRACIKLRERLANSDEIIQLSENFVMVEVEGEDSHSTLCAPDGFYYPRIVFVRSDGYILYEVKNDFWPDDCKHKYFYQHAEDVANSMRRTIEINRQFFN